jgi:hypothetical protein
MRTANNKNSMKLKLYNCLFLLLTMISINKSNGQSSSLINESNPGYTPLLFGSGVGMDYGAIGIKAEFLPSKYLGVFAGAGHALIDPAFNAGVSAKLLPYNKFCPTIRLCMAIMRLF